MTYDVAKVVLQASSGAYSPIKDMFSYMKDKAKYVKNLEDNLTKITAQLATFYSRKEQIDRSLETSLSKERSDEYGILVKQIEVFLKRYNKFIDKYGKYCHDLPRFCENDISSAMDVIDDVQQRKPTILTHKFFKLAELSKEINELLDHISRVAGEMKPENVLRDKKIEVVQVKHDGIDLPSSAEYVKKIMGYLKEDDNRSIGILGPIGVGKTTIMKKLNNQLRHSPSLEKTMEMKFEVVIWIDYHKQRDVGDKTTEVIQDEIMGRLKLNREKTNSIEQNANIISGFLGSKKYIFLIDQVSSTVNLDEVGIHKDHPFGKVVIASSSRKVIIQMTDEQVEIHPLSKNDALDLFQKFCGTIYDRRIKLIADGIIRSCGGLPLVIKLVANHLKGVNDEKVWSDVKLALQSETKAKLQDLEGVGHAYKLVYDKLEESHMKCLLFATLFPSDHKIYKDYLVECWNAERFLELDIEELRSARERGATVLRELTDQYLLENHSAKHVKMPEYFRKVAMEQKYPGEKDSLSWAPQKTQRLTQETWRTTRRMSLISCKSKVPENPKNESITTLLMQGNHDLVAIGDPFFLNMQKLRILDLHRTMIESLPNSISNLVSLVCLYLNDCPLLAKLPPEVKKLEKLELLDIRGTSIRSLPIELGGMINLKCLRLSFSQLGCNSKRKCKEVEMEIHHKIINRLHKLEELTIEVGCCCKTWDCIAEQIVNELACLEKLSTLNFHFPSVSTLAEFVVKSKSLESTDTHWGSNTLRSFNISIGCCEMQHPYSSDISGISAERQLRLGLSTKRQSRFSTNEEISLVGEVLRQASSFELAGHCGVRSLSDFDLENTGTLKVCVVECCNNMLSVVDVSNINVEKTDYAMLQCLEKLHLFDLQLLQSIWKGPVFSGSLANLKVLSVFGCPKLTAIFNHEQAKALSSLEHVKVENCSKVVEIMEEGKLDGQNIPDDVNLYHILNKVTTIELVNLPGLESICKSTSMKWRSLLKIEIISCNKLTDFHLTLGNAEKIEKIKCEASWWTALQFPEEQEQLFLPLCEFVDLEQNLKHEAESSQRGRLVNYVPSNANVSEKYNGKVMPRNGKNHLLSNTNYVDHTGLHKIVNTGLQDSPESSQRIDHDTHRSTNSNAAPNNETMSLPEETCSKLELPISSH